MNASRPRYVLAIVTPEGERVVYEPSTRTVLRHEGTDLPDRWQTSALDARRRSNEGSYVRAAAAENRGRAPR